MQPRLRIDADFFTAQQLGQVAELDENLVKAWLHRKLIRPTGVRRIAGRKRPMFSVIEIFKAKLLRLLWEHASIPPSFLAREIADEGWMWSIAASVDRNETYLYIAGVSFAGGKLRWVIDKDVRKIAAHFAGEPYVVIPVAEIFEAIYRACKGQRQAEGAIDAKRSG